MPTCFLKNEAELLQILPVVRLKGTPVSEDKSFWRHAIVLHDVECSNVNFLNKRRQRRRTRTKESGVLVVTGESPENEGRTCLASE